MANYPAQIDNSLSLPVAVDNMTPVNGQVFNRLRNAVISIETELGVKPSSVYSTVKSRLDTLETQVNNITTIHLDGDLGGTESNPVVIGIQGQPISTTDPAADQYLGWNGIAWEPKNIDFPLSFLPPIDLVYVASLQTNSQTTPLAIGSRTIDMSHYPATLPDGRNRLLQFVVGVKVSNNTVNGSIRLFDTTHDVEITSSIINFNNTIAGEMVVTLTAGTTDETIRTNAVTRYEAHIYTATNDDELAICNHARVMISYS